MRVLMTGGTGLIGQVTTAALLRRGHTVRLMARRASRTREQWPENVEAVDGSMTDAASITRAVEGCDVIVHLASLARLVKGEPGFEEVNVEGTRTLLAAAEKAGIKRFVYISSLGAERGKSPYHQTKHAAEKLTRGFSREWTILRPANVYGPGDEVISLLLRMVRALPVVPTVDGGQQPFQPIWVEDVAEAIAGSIDQPDVLGRALDLAGPDTTSMDDLIDRLGALTGRHPARVSVPGFLAVLGSRAGSMLGLDLPLDPGQLTMLEEGNLLPPGAPDALREVFHLEPTSIDAGLKKLTHALPEQLQGVGELQHRRIWAAIEGSRLSAEELFAHFCRHFSDLTPWHVAVGSEPDCDGAVRAGATLTMHLPLRGNVQVRVAEFTPRSATLVTVAGHPLAGAVCFRVDPDTASDGGHSFGFHIEVHERASNMIDWMLMASGGSTLQLVTWRQTVEHAIEASGGRAPAGVQDETEELDDERARQSETWLRSLVDHAKRAEHEAAIATGDLVNPPHA